MQNPIELLEMVSKVSDRLFLWTHYDKQVLKDNPNIPEGKFKEGKASEVAGFKHALYQQDYAADLQWDGFCGGTEHDSYWLERQAIFDALKYFGFNTIEIYGEQTINHHNGPCFSIIATK